MNSNKVIHHLGIIKRTLLPMCSMALISSISFADELPFSFNGFLTAGGATTDESAATFVGADNRARFNIDSIIGLQFGADVNEKLSATVQFLAKGAEDYKVTTEWAYLTYQANDSIDVRAGRLRIPFFMISDYLEVGFAYPWIRPPQEVYGQLAFNKFDGLDAIFKQDIGNFTFSIQPLFGSTSPDVGFGSLTASLDVTNLWGLNLTLGNEWVSFRLGRTEGDFDITIPGFPTIAGPVTFADTKKHGTFTGAGINLNWNNVVVMSEYTQRTTDSAAISDTNGWYMMTGYQLGDFLPHVTFGSIRNNNKVDQPQTEQDSVTLGLRWDAMEGVALKTELQRIDVKNGTAGLLSSSTPGFSSDINVLSIAVDVIF